MNRKGSTLLSLGISVALIAASILFLYNHHVNLGYGNTHWMMPHHMISNGYGMGIIVFLFWGAVLAATILIVSGALSNRHTSHPHHHEPHADSLEILKQRYARGEINKAQFESMRHELR